MDDSLEHYNTLLALKSNVYFAGRFESLRDDMQKIIRNYDNLGGLFSSSEPKIEAFEDVPELNRNMLALEIDTVLSKEYTPNEIKLSQMKDNDFNEYAPKTYNAAQLKLVEFKTYIKAHHLDRDGIVKRKASLEFEYSHLAHVVNEVKYLKHEDDDEKVVLDQEAKYLTLMNSLEMSDSRDKPTEAQYQMIVAGIDNIKVTATVGITQNITKIATLEKELEALKLEAKTYKEEELVAKTTAEELNMEMMTVKMEVENLSKELEKQKQLNEELATKKLEDLYTPEEKKQEVVVEIPTAENKEEIK